MGPNELSNIIDWKIASHIFMKRSLLYYHRTVKVSSQIGRIYWTDGENCILSLLALEDSLQKQNTKKINKNKT